MNKRTQKELADYSRSQAEIKERARRAAVLKDLERAAARAEAREAVKQKGPDLIQIKPFRPGRTKIGDQRQACAVACASDWHVGELVTPAHVQGLNEYNPDIADARAARFFAGIEWLIREQQSMFAINHLLLWLGGDFLSGYIHRELIESNTMSPVEEVRFCRSLLIRGIRFLLKHTELEHIFVVCNFGNHDRTTDKLQVATTGKNSYTWLMYHDLAEVFEDEPRVKFKIAGGHHVVTDVFGMRIHTTHGDSVRSNGGIGGVDVPLNRAAVQWHAKYKAHLSMVGHFHQLQIGQRVVRNGSLIGYNEYADFLPGAAPEPPQQAFFLVDSKRGQTQCAPIWVGE